MVLPPAAAARTPALWCSRVENSISEMCVSLSSGQAHLLRVLFPSGRGVGEMGGAIAMGQASMMMERTPRDLRHLVS